MALAPRLLPVVRAVEAYRQSAGSEPLVADIGCYVGNLAVRLARGGAVRENGVTHLHRGTTL